MNTSIKVIIAVVSIIGVAAMLSPLDISAQEYAIKAYGDIGLGKGLSMTTALPDMTSKSSSNVFGIDFGWTFWKKNANSIEANVGLGYRMAYVAIDVSSMSYNYTAPAAADEDGNPYQRYTTLSNLQQKINLGYFTIPIYFQYQYRATKWLGVYAVFGFNLGFKCTGSVGSTSGIADSYGVYPQYDDLVIKADYLNDFGERPLNGTAKGDLEVKGFSTSVIVAAGLEFYVSGPISIDLGVRYNQGLTTVFGNQYDTNSTASISAENAPVKYTVAQGQYVKALSSYVTKSHLNSFSIHIGVNVRF